MQSHSFKLVKGWILAVLKIMYLFYTKEASYRRAAVHELPFHGLHNSWSLARLGLMWNSPSAGNNLPSAGISKALLPSSLEVSRRSSPCYHLLIKISFSCLLLNWMISEGRNLVFLHIPEPPWFLVTFFQPETGGLNIQWMGWGGGESTPFAN